MCCPSKSCCFCFLIIILIILVGFVFGFGIFADGFKKIRDLVHVQSEFSSFPAGKRPFFAPPPLHYL